jgi:hypothetical protein
MALFLKIYLNVRTMLEGYEEKGGFLKRMIGLNPLLKPS